MPTPRDLTPQEAAVVEWLLANATIVGAKSFRAQSLQVVGTCHRGCASLDFSAEVAGPKTIVSEAVAVYPDQQQAGVIL